MEQRKSIVSFEPLSRILQFSVPHLQRLLDKNHIKEMVEDQKKEYDKFGCFSMLQSITVGVICNDIYILDGNHRMRAYEKLGQLNYPIGEVILPVVIYHVQSQDELIEYFNRINKHMPIHPFEMDTAWIDYGKVFCAKFVTAFSAYIKGKENDIIIKGCKCPHISLHELKSHLAGRNIGEVLRASGETIDKLFNCIWDINSFVKDVASSRTQFDSSMSKRIKDCEKKATGVVVCYLGVWRRFEWLDIALHLLKIKSSMSESHIGLSDFTVSRVKVPAVLRELVWKKHNKNICDDGECYTCTRSLKYTEMECGHIIAKVLGGQETLPNFMPVCRVCNRDMGIMNLLEYKEMIDRCGGNDMMEIT
jgi:hypothetical protein